MPTSSRSVRITVQLAATEYRAFTSAVRKLRSIMGRRAPDVAALIQFSLQNRDAAGIADDYLDAIGWPANEGRMVSLMQKSESGGE